MRCSHCLLSGRRDGARQETQKKRRNKGEQSGQTHQKGKPTSLGTVKHVAVGQGVTQPSTETKGLLPPPCGTPRWNGSTPGAGRAWSHGGGRFTELVERAEAVCWHRGSAPSAAARCCSGLSWMELQEKGFTEMSPGGGLCRITDTVSLTSPQRAARCACTPIPVSPPLPKPPAGAAYRPSACAGSTTAPLSQVSQPPPFHHLPPPPPPTRGSLVKSDNRRGGIGGDRGKPGFPN